MAALREFRPSRPSFLQGFLYISASPMISLPAHRGAQTTRAYPAPGRPRADNSIMP